MVNLSVTILTFLLAFDQGVSARDVTPCELVAKAKELNGEEVRIRSAITIGAHDEYLVAQGCAADLKETDYIFLTFDKTDRSVKELVRLLQKQARRSAREKVVATLSGKLEAAAYGKFGFMSAKVKLQVNRAADIRVTR